MRGSQTSCAYINTLTKRAFGGTTKLITTKLICAWVYYSMTSTLIRELDR